MWTLSIRFLFLIYVVMCAIANPLPLHSQESEIPPFEKIYVSPYEILTTPYGSFYLSPNGQYEPVRAILRDNEGTYIIKITRQCPTCGRCHTGRYSNADGYSCSLDQIQPEEGLYPIFEVNPQPDCISK